MPAGERQNDKAMAWSLALLLWARYGAGKPDAASETRRSVSGASLTEGEGFQPNRRGPPRLRDPQPWSQGP